MNRTRVTIRRNDGVAPSSYEALGAAHDVIDSIHENITAGNYAAVVQDEHGNGKIIPLHTIAAIDVDRLDTDPDEPEA